MNNDSPDNLVPLGPRVKVHPDALQYSFVRSSGPGGQSVNKLNTKAELRVRVADLEGLGDAAAARLRRLAGQKLTREDEILITADTTRSQAKNREACLERLRELVLKAQVAPKRRKKTRPGKAARERRLKEKRIQAEKKQRRGASGPPEAGM